MILYCVLIANRLLIRRRDPGNQSHGNSSRAAASDQTGQPARRWRNPRSWGCVVPAAKVGGSVYRREKTHDVAFPCSIKRMLNWTYTRRLKHIHTQSAGIYRQYISRPLYGGGSGVCAYSVFDVYSFVISFLLLASCMYVCMYVCIDIYIYIYIYLYIYMFTHIYIY